MTVICSSSNPLQLRSALKDFDPASVRGIISFGVAGGLDPTLATGDIVVATEVVVGDGRWTAAAGLSGELIGAIGDGGRPVRRGILAGSEVVVPSPQEKAALRAATAAAVVDMESHIAAAYAVAVGLPFAALRVVSDPASRSLPAIATHALKPDGRVDVWKVLRGVVREPSAVPHLMRTGRDFNRALVTLRGCRRLLLGDGGRLLGSGGSLVTADL
jgi:hopanoid-associated phosphorylase